MGVVIIEEFVEEWELKDGCLGMFCMTRLVIVKKTCGVRKKIGAAVKRR